MIKNSIKGIVKHLVICCNSLFVALLTILTYSVIFTNNATWDKFSMSKQVIYVILGGISLTFAYLLLHRRIDQLSRKAVHIVVAIVMMILIIFQIIAIGQTYTPIGWDVGYIIRGAGATVTGDNSVYSEYFSWYPNNLFLTFLFKFANFIVSSIRGNSNTLLLAIFINIVAIDISLILVFYIVKKMLNDKYALYAYFLCIITYGTFAWMIVPYSDTMALPLTTGAFALYLLKKSNESKVVNWVCNIGLGIMCWINYMVKPTAIIIFIAIFIVEVAFYIINNNLKAKLKMLCITLLMMGVGYGIMNASWSQFIKAQPYFKIDETKAVPMQHFMMMGLTQTGDLYGAWNQEDVDYTFAYATTEERKKANVVRIKEKLKGYGVFGYLDYLMTKARWITSEGTFFWFKEGDFANDRHMDNSLFKNLWYPEGKYYDRYQYISQTIWIWILIMCSMPIGLILRRQDRQFDYWHSVVRCTLTGIILFILLFEGRSRYLILYLPFFCILAIMGANDVKEYLIAKKNKNQ